MEEPSRLLTGVSGTIPRSRDPYIRLEKTIAESRFKFSTANISESHSLKPGSFIVFVFHEQMYLGRGES